MPNDSGIASHIMNDRGRFHSRPEASAQNLNRRPLARRLTAAIVFRSLDEPGSHGRGSSSSARVRSSNSPTGLVTSRRAAAAGKRHCGASPKPTLLSLKSSGSAWRCCTGSVLASVEAGINSACRRRMRREGRQKR